MRTLVAYCAVIGWMGSVLLQNRDSALISVIISIIHLFQLPLPERGAAGPGEEVRQLRRVLLQHVLGEEEVQGLGQVAHLPQIVFISKVEWC